MKKLKLYLIIILFVGGCQTNNMEPPFDCATSDLTITAIVTSTDCGLASGRIEIIATEGEQPYSYSINDEVSQGSPVFDGLFAGEYSTRVIDNRGCSSEGTALVSNKNGLTVSATTTNSDCTIADGTISVNATNGVEPYQFQLGSGVPQLAADFIVAAGSHEITVTDANGCDFVLTKFVNSNTSYALDVQAIIANSCSVFGCHDGSNSSLPNFNNFSELTANASMVKSRTQSGNMPKTGSLTQTQIDLIACWVDDGAKNN